MALVVAAKFQYGAFMSSPYFHITVRRLLRFFFDAGQPWYVVTQQLTNHSVIFSWTRASEATCSSGFPARIGTDSPIVIESRKGRHCEVVKPRVVRIEGVKHPDFIAYLLFYTKDNSRYWACGKDTVSWSFWLRNWSARAVFHIVLEAHQRVLFCRRVRKIARSDY
jgi:hypothetical protein